MNWNLESSQLAFNEGRIQAWIEEYLQVAEWRNLGLLGRVQKYSRTWLEPRLVPISSLYRVAGPGDSFRFPKDPGQWATEVSLITNANPTLVDLPPIIVWREHDGVLNVADGNHRLSALEQLGFHEVWTLIHDGPLRSKQEIEARIAKLEQSHLLAERFRVFASECEGTSPLYQKLSLEIAEDSDLLELVGHAQPGQPKPNLLFAAVQFLLVEDTSHPLAKFYPSLSRSAGSTSSAFPDFRSFTLDNKGSIKALLETKLVQTNEVQRCAYLYPSFLTCYRFFGGRPLCLIELGASAGLNLLWDQYSYSYDNGGIVGNVDSELLLRSEFRGSLRPNLEQPIPNVVRRIGLDLNPILLNDPEQVKWLQALIWPEQLERKARLETAISIAKNSSLEMISGDGIALLQAIFREIEPECVVAVYHTHVANQLSPAQRNLLLATIDDFGKTRDVMHIHNNIEPHLHGTIYKDAQRIDIPLAHTEGHAKWTEWLVTHKEIG